MSEFESNPQFLKDKYDLHNSPEVKSAKNRTELRTKEKLSNNPEATISNYLDRFNEIIKRTDLNKKERGINAFKKIIFDKYLTEYEEIPESYWDFQKRVMKERGELGDWENASDDQKETIKRQTAETLLADQKASLEQWIDYMSTTDSDYMPDYLKYWVFRSVTGLQEYDKDEKKFPKRSKGTVKQFPDINHEALAHVVDSVIKKFQKQSPDYNYDIEKADKQKFEQYLQNENFAKLYAWSIERINLIPEHLLKVTTGEWKKYEKDSDYKPLTQSINGKGTGWCTAGENTAKKQLTKGDLYIYYSQDDNKKSTIPRIAIRTEDNKIVEVGGIAFKQNLDPYIIDVFNDKLGDFSNGKDYLEKVHDMRLLTDIDNKTKEHQEPTKDNLVFLYEINSKIDSFSYQDDPRIKKIISQRDIKTDAPIVFGCEPSQIAWSQDEINENTRAYIGALFEGVFDFPNLEYIYTAFPEKRVQIGKLAIGGKNKETLEQELYAPDRETNKPKFRVTDDAKDILNKIFANDEFIANSQKSPQQIKTFQLSFSDLGFTKLPTTEQLYARAKKLDLDICPAEVGIYQRINDDKQPTRNHYLIAMQEIMSSSNHPTVLFLSSDGINHLNLSCAEIVTNYWDLNTRLLFCIKPSIKF